MPFRLKLWAGTRSQVGGAPKRRKSKWRPKKPRRRPEPSAKGAEIISESAVTRAAMPSYRCAMSPGGYCWKIHAGKSLEPIWQWFQNMYQMATLGKRNQSRKPAVCPSSFILSHTHLGENCMWVPDPTSFWGVPVHQPLLRWVPNWYAGGLVMDVHGPL